MTKFLGFLGLKPKTKERIDYLKKAVAVARKKDIADIRRATKTIQLMVDEGSVEITIKNIKKVIKEIK